MKKQGNMDVDAFFKEVNACEGTVELVTDTGARMNLKSLLSQYISMAKYFSGNTTLSYEVVASRPEEGRRLQAVMGRK